MTNSAFGFQRPEDSPGFLLWQTTVVWQRRIKQSLEEYNLSHSQFVILAILLWLEENKQPQTQSIIIQLSKLDKMTVSKALKVLVSLSLVSRKECLEDTRAKLVELTSKGKKLVSKLIPIVEDIDKDFFSNLNKKEQTSLIHFLCQILEN